MSSQMLSAWYQRPPSVAARMAAVKAWTLGAIGEPETASLMVAYMAKALSVRCRRVQVCRHRQDGVKDSVTRIQSGIQLQEFTI